MTPLVETETREKPTVPVCPGWVPADRITLDTVARLETFAIGPVALFCFLSHGIVMTLWVRPRLSRQRVAGAAAQLEQSRESWLMQPPFQNEMQPPPSHNAPEWEKEVALSCQQKITR